MDLVRMSVRALCSQNHISDHVLLQVHIPEQTEDDKSATRGISMGIIVLHCPTGGPVFKYMHIFPQHNSKRDTDCNIDLAT